ncbi:Virion core protein [Sea otter poxvirus]|uniref:Virion core protein n=1 Tax=Sea otter poxvirus TaxID=1416741 RepID=A0A2U9QHQ2_9POXV|nr:Virion core protein [Sea otter poxvirus]AWU47123.1 Virion core protein [Sea otter poxvirus]
MSMGTPLDILTKQIDKCRILFPSDIKELLNAKFIVVNRGSDGLPNTIYIYNTVARFDNTSIYKIAKYVFRNNKNLLMALFPSEEVLDSIPMLQPDRTLILRDVNNDIDTTSDCITPEDIKRALIILMNAFRTNDEQHNMPWYYLSLRKDIHNIIMQ